MPWFLHLAGFLLPALLTLALYASTTRLGFFHLDDPSYVVNNPLIQEMTPANFKEILVRPYFANYSPLHILSYAVDHRLAGLSAAAFHLSSNLWGAAVAGLVYGLAFLMTRRFGPSLLAGLLFAAHPAHVEAIAWISSRKDLVAAAFAIPALMAYLLYRRPGQKGWIWYGLSVLLFALAEAGKQSVVILPGVFLLHDWLVEKRRDWRRLAADKIPFLLIGAAFALYVNLAQPPTRHVFNAFVFGHSMAWLAWLVTGLGDYVLYRARPSQNLSAGVETVFILFPVFAAALPFMVRKYLKPPWLVLYGWLLLALVPPLMLNFIHPVADRYLFFPSAPFCILLAWAGFDVLARAPRWPRMLPIAGLLAVLGVWTVSTRTYLQTWHDPRSVWYSASDKSNGFYPPMYLGSHYQDRADEISTAKLSGQDLRELARAIWHDDDRAEHLAREWEAKQMGSAEVEAFRNELLGLAMAQYELAVRRKGTLVQPNLFFRRGKIKMDTDDLVGAERELRMAYDQARIHTYESTRQELSVMSQYGLGVVEWRRKNYPQARDYIQAARDEQVAAGGRWVPDIDRQLARITSLAAREPSPDSAAP